MYKPKKKKKATATRALAAAAGALLAVALGACSSQGAATNLGATHLGESTLVVPTNQSPWLPAYKALVAKYTAKTGVKVDLRAFPYDELRTQLINDVQGGTHTYDVYQIGEANMFEFLKNGWMQPLAGIDPSFKPDANTVDPSSFAYWDSKTNTSSPNGKLMVQPLQYTIQLLMYRSDIYKELGLTAPKTWADVLANGKAAMAAGKVKYGYILRGQPSTGAGTIVTYDFEPFLYSYGGSWFANADKGDWTPTVNTPQAIAAATMMRELAKLGPAQTTTIGQAQVISAMQAGDALQSNLVDGAAAQLESQSDSNIAGKVGFSVLPAGASGKPGVTSNLFALGVPAGLNKTRSKAALDFIKWVNSKEAQTVFTQAGGAPTRTDVLKDKSVNKAADPYLSQVAASNKNTQSGTRYVFTAQMLPITEKWISQIVAGMVSPTVGLNNMQADLEKMIRAQNYPMGAR